MVVTVSPTISKSVVLHLLPSYCPPQFPSGYNQKKMMIKGCPLGMAGNRFKVKSEVTGT